MSETEEIHNLIREYNVRFPLRIGILSRSIRSITEAKLSPFDYLVVQTEPFSNMEDLDLWLQENKDKKHLLLIPC